MKKSYIVTRDGFNQRLKNVTNLLRTGLLSIFFVLGVISFNSLDIFLGGVTYSSGMTDMPINILGFSVSGEIIGWALSITFWFIQYIAWKRVLEDGKITIQDIPVLAVCILLGFGDTIGDVAPVYLYVSRSSFIGEAMSVSMSGTSLGILLLNVIQYSVMIMTFFSEAINSFIFYDVDDKLISFNFNTRNKETSNHNIRKKKTDPFAAFQPRKP